MEIWRLKCGTHRRGHGKKKGKRREKVEGEGKKKRGKTP